MSVRTVLVTGATGVVGSALVPLLLREPETRVRLLVRADSDERLRERLAGLLDYWQLGSRAAELLGSGRLRALRGDACRPRMGLADLEREELIGEITHLVDAVGNVKFNQPMAEARAGAMGAVRSAVELARAAQARGRFVKLDWVSTVGVAGCMPGLLREEPVRAARQFHNTYEATKAEAEDFLLAEMARGLPATIHRPSMVIGDSASGRVIHFQVFYHLCEFLSGRRTCGLLPDFGGFKLDVVPADYVAAAIGASIASPEASGRILHLCSGPARALALDACGDLFRSLLAARGGRLPAIRRIRRRWLRLVLPIVVRVVPGRAGRALRTLPHFLNYLEEAQAFDNSRTCRFLEGRGVALPHPEEYLGRVLGWYLDRRSCSKRAGSCQAQLIGTEQAPPLDGVA